MEKKSLKISIALTTFNGELHLLEQLNSFLFQNRMPDELIACDDGSNDNTLNILKNFSKSSPFPVKIIENELNLGFSQNFSKAISECTGDIIFLSDHDDIWLPDKLFIMEKKYIENPKLNACFSDSLLMDENGILLKKTLFEMNGFTSPELFKKNEGALFLVKKNFIAGHALSFRSKLREHILPIPKNVLHDVWLVSFFSIIGNFECIPIPLVKYRLHKNQNIGVSSGTLFERLSFRWNRAKKQNILQLREQIFFYSELIQRAENFEKTFFRDLYKEKLIWLKRKKNFSPWKILRFFQIAFSLKNYYLFENGISSALKDAIFF